MNYNFLFRTISYFDIAYFETCISFTENIKIHLCSMCVLLRLKNLLIKKGKYILIFEKKNIASTNFDESVFSNDFASTKISNFNQNL